MSTHAAIGIQNPDGSVSWIYEHTDGGYYRLGSQLFWAWNSEKLARSLIEGGGGYQTKGTSPSVEAFRNREEYTYLWRRGEWWTCFRYQNLTGAGFPKVRQIRWHKLRTVINTDAPKWTQPGVTGTLELAAQGKIYF